jgi:drug/metabolite transporter (DMT)-like permease
MSDGLLLGLGAALAWGLTDVAAALAGRRVGSLRVALGTQATGAVVLGLVGLLAFGSSGAGRAVEPGMVALAALSGVVASLGYLGAFTALRMGPVSIVSPVISAYGGLTVILAVLVRGESLGIGQAIGAAVATVGVMLTGLELGAGARSARLAGPGVAFAVLALVGFAGGTILGADPIRSIGFLPAITVGRLANVLFIGTLLTVALRRRPRWARPLLESAPGPDPVLVVDAIGLGVVGPRVAPAEPPVEPAMGGSRWRWWPVVAAGLLDVIGFTAFGLGIEISLVWLVGLVSSFGPVVAVAVAVAWFGERPRPVQWLGMVAIGLGILLVGLPA